MFVDNMIIGKDSTFINTFCTIIINNTILIYFITNKLQENNDL